MSGLQTNNHYPNRHEITSSEDLAAAAAFDHVAATYKNNHRSNENFLVSDCVVMDIDNDHTENPAEWITPESLSELMAGVAFMTATSRNHMKIKGKESARPRFHVYYPITQVSDATEYAGLKKRLASRFGFFDTNALDAGRFIYGNPTPEVTAFEDNQLLDEWLAAADEQDMFAVFDTSTQAIGEGSRNATLSRFAGRVLIRYGNTTQARELFDRKASLCDPPLPAAELALIWDSACKFAAKVAAQPDYVPPEVFEQLTSLRPDDFTDVGQATLLAGEYADRICFSPATKWLAYHQGAWCESEPKARLCAQELTERQLKQAILDKAKAFDGLTLCGADQIVTSGAGKATIMKHLSAQQVPAYLTYEDAKAWERYVLGRRETKKISAALKEAEPLLEIDPAGLDADPYALNTPSGTYDLRTGEKHAHDPADLITRQTALDPNQAGMEIWLDSLAVTFGGDAELIRYVQRVCGLAAIGRVLIEALIIAYGDGCNGKSTFWNTIARVLGTYAETISSEVLIAGRKNNAKNDMAETRGKRLLLAGENEEGVRLSTSSANQLASTDKIAAEKKYKDPFSFTPSHTLVLYTNHLPRVGASDTGIWRRLIVIPFEETIRPDTDIKNYADHLYEHAGGAVLAWIMEGARAIHAEGYKLVPPPRVVAASDAYREANDWFSHFLEERCRVEVGLEDKSKDVYDAYRAWALGRGEYVRSAADFYAAVDKAGFGRRRTRAAKLITGLQLINEFEL
ncbi:phage/plasmid primase, P4 family [Corynebacterium belfantii]|uniref:phage/plasmid primase, P4 family n=1 Tax=Corynebacterium belfantii TaxID=2014537 RepID=UPI002E1983C2|nr:phage/plasmid primase, P4 family [Corynebacterium belfantii]